MKKILFITALIITANVSANDSWPASAKIAYVDRCAISMQTQGLPKMKAKPYCTCIANGMESEFGMREYDAMMSAQPNPNGTKSDRRLYRIVKNCGTKL